MNYGLDCLTKPVNIFNTNNGLIWKHLAFLIVNNTKKNSNGQTIFRVFDLLVEFLVRINL